MDKTLHQVNVMKAIAFIESNLTSSISVEDVCSQIPMSPWQFQRVFRFSVGCSIGIYLRGRRLSEAFQQLLQNSEAKIIDLALEFQFGSPEAFTRSFKSYFGVLPSEARQKSDLFELKGTPPLSETTMDVIWNSVRDISEPRPMGPFEFWGVRKDVPSPFAENADYENKTLEVWNEFGKRMKTSPKSERFSFKSYGVALNSKDRFTAAMMDYLACKPSYELLERPEGFESFHLPQEERVTFSITGSLREVQTLVDYIYAIWLPASKFQRAPSYDFEKFDFQKTETPGVFFYSYNLPVLSK